MQLFFTFILLFLSSTLSVNAVEMLYQTSYKNDLSENEKKWVEHAKASFDNASRLQSNLTNQQFNDTDRAMVWRKSTLPKYHSLQEITQISYYHLLNNLCNHNQASHLHIGLLAGDSFIAALFGNQSKVTQQIGVDWFQECPEEIFIENCNQYLNPDKYEIINNGCFDVDKKLLKKPINVYLYDADHSLMAHEKAFTYYNNSFANIFIAVVDDWQCPWIRIATFKAFRKLKYEVLYENYFDTKDVDNQTQYVVVIKKK